MACATVYLSLGTNLGDRVINLWTAMRALAPELTLVKASPMYETAPWGYTDQPSFLNQVLQAETQLPPLPLLQHLKQLETSQGRQPAVRYGPRLIDFDILLYDELVLDSPELTIPHPRLHERAFVLVPLHDVAAPLCHPVLKQNIRILMANVQIDGIKVYKGT